MGISQYVIIILSLTIFLIPVSQVDAIFFFPTEISDEELSKIIKEIQKLKMEKFRDYYFEKNLKSQNPYNNKMSDSVIIFNDQKFNMSISVDRSDENFQTLKDEQLDLAQKKYLEIMGGKIITSSLGDKPDKRIIPILEFTDEEESFMETIHRDDEGFKSYKIQQIILAENTVNRLIQEEIWEEDPFIVTELFEDYYDANNSVKDVETVSAAFDLIDDGIVTAEELIENNVISSEDLIQDNVISASNLKAFWMSYEPVESTKTEVVQETLVITEKDDFDWKEYEWVKSERGSQEFQNLIQEQVLSAEQLRNESFGFAFDSNPDEEKNVIEITQSEIIEFEPSIHRDDEKFQEYLLEQIEKAELILKDFYHLKNLDEEKINDEQNEKEFFPPKADNRNELFLNLLKLEEDKAEKKLIELLKGKTISNFVDVKTKVGSISKIKTNQNDVNLSNYKKFLNYELELIALLGDKIREKNNEENVWYLSLYIISEKNEIENMPIQELLPKKK